MHSLKVELPADPSIAKLADEERLLVARVWGDRAASELGAAMAFTSIAQRLMAQRQPAEIQYLAACAVGDEVRHCGIALDVARAYGLDASWPSVTPPAGDDDDFLIVATCCVNETLGGAFLQASLDRAEAPLVRKALHELLRDEVDHGRIGWAFVNGMSIAGKDQLSSALPSLLTACLRVWSRRLEELPSEGVPKHGVLAPDTIREVVCEAIDSVVLPGFSHCGIRVGTRCEEHAFAQFS